MMRRSGSAIWNIMVLIIVGIIVVWTLFPIYWMLSTSLKSHTEVFKNPPDIWPSNPGIQSYYNLNSGITPIKTFFVNSVVTSVSTVIIAVVLAVLASYVLSRFEFKMRRPILLGILVTQMFPLVVLIIPLYILYLKMHLLNTYLGLIIAFTSFTLPFGIWMIKGFVDKVPYEVDEAAIVDGCSRFQILWRIILPVITPGIVATAVFSFLDAWNNLLFPLTLVNSVEMKTLPPGMILAFGGEFKHDWSGMMAASSVVALPVIIVFVVLQKYLVEGLTGGAVKG